MVDCCILFLHHRDDEVTRHHLHVLRQMNPYPVVAICRGSNSRVDGAVDVFRFDDSRLGEDVWSSADATLCTWFRNRGLDARRYIVFEWDTLATLPVREVYDEVWSLDVAAANVFRWPKDAEWNWFQQRDRLPMELREAAVGLMPFCGLMLSHRALAALAAFPFPPDVYCELRAGTILNSLGYTLGMLPEHLRQTISWHPQFIRVARSVPGVYHPVKSLSAMQE